MEEATNIMKVTSGEKRTPTQKLRDEIELQKCQIENLQRENQQLKDDLADAIQLGTVCFLCGLQDTCPGPHPRPIDTDEGHDYGDVCPEHAQPRWIGMPEDADE